MSTPWPAGLPQGMLLEGLSLGRKQAWLETPMEFGSKRRRRYTAQRRPITVRVQFTGTELATFESFYDSDLGGGTLPFAWTHPATGATVDMQFVAPPTFVPFSGGTSSTRLWEASLSLEILP